MDIRSTILSNFPIDLYKLNEIDFLLQKQGVDFLSDQETALFFSQHESMDNHHDIQPSVNLPVSSKNQWMSYRSTVTASGKVNNFQKLVAQPKNVSSGLYNIGNRTITYNKKWTAGLANMLKSIATSSIGSIPGANITVSIYDAISSFVTGISSTTEVYMNHISYSYSATTTASFTYVRLQNQTDDYQVLSMISTRSNAVVMWQAPTVTYGKNLVLIPGGINGSSTIRAVPAQYDNSVVALNAYNSSSSLPAFRAVTYIDITAPDNKQVQKIYPVYPQFLSHCE